MSCSLIICSLLIFSGSNENLEFYAMHHLTEISINGPAPPKNNLGDNWKIKLRNINQI